MSEVCHSIVCVQLFNLAVYGCSFSSLVCLREYDCCIIIVNTSLNPVVFLINNRSRTRLLFPLRVTDLLAFPVWSRCLVSPDNPVKLNLIRCGL